MNPVQEQLSTMESKVDALHQAMEQLDHKLTTTLSQQNVQSPSQQSGAILHESSLYTSPSMSHKDVLAESNAFDSDQKGAKSITPEIQIQRLTAQLMAAYNRIAALEEQLLAQRVH